MILPTLTITVEKSNGHDVYGQPAFAPGRKAKVCPIKLKFSTQHTTVRTDSSGTHGAADEAVADVVLLALPAAQIGEGDRLVINGHKVKVTAVHPRYEVGGRLDHYQLDCIAWT